MNRPTPAPSFGPLAHRIGIRRHQRTAVTTLSPTTRHSGRAAWLRLFPAEDGSAPMGRGDAPGRTRVGVTHQADFALEPEAGAPLATQF
jgi:hypothetical protein